ncbi:hypothetical protein [Sphingomonas sp. 1185]|uniref:hypothetical protein n=1 Tax=Sphingomonas sp. 1185 TaxID=3156411 RepID=UPI00339B00A6
MSRDLIVSVRLKADGSGLVGAAKDSATAIAGIGTAAGGATVQARQLVAAIGEASRAAGVAGTGREASAALEATARSSVTLGGSAKQASAAMAQLTDQSRGAATGADELVAAAGRVARAHSTTTAKAAEAARAASDLARAERDAAREAVTAAESRLAQAKGRVELTAENPTITLSPGGGGTRAAGDAKAIATATAELAQARQRAEAAEDAYSQSLRGSAQASDIARAAVTALATQSQAGVGNTGQLAEALERTGTQARSTAQAAHALADAADTSSDASRQLATATDQATEAANGQARATNAQSQARGQAQREAAELAAAEARLASATNETEREEAAAAIAAIKLAQAQREAARRTREAEAESRRNAFAVRNLGQQFGDAGLQAVTTGDIVRSFTQQLGQMGYALSEMSGTAGKFGAFLTGPWGIALTVGAAVILPFVENLFKAEEAAEAAKLGANGLSEAQSVLGEMFDLTSGKLKKQNELLVLNARLTAINLRASAAKDREESRKTFADAGSVSVSDRLRGFYEGEGLLFGSADPLAGIKGAINGSARGSQNARNLAAVVKDLEAGKTTANDVIQAAEKFDFTGLKIDRREFLNAIVKRASAPLNDQIADQIDRSLDDGELAKGLRRDAKTKKPPKPKSTEARDEFGRDAAARIAGITDQFDRTPPAVRQANAALRQLDDIMDDLARKKPPEFKELIAQAQEAKGVVRDGLNRPIADFVESQQQAFEVGQQLLYGHRDQAEALRVIQQLERQRGPLTQEQKDAVLATTQALIAQDRQLERMAQRQRIYLAGLQDIRGLITATISGDSGLEKLPERLMQAFNRVSAEKIVDSLFGDLFQQLEDRVTGTSVVEDASARMADAVDVVATRTGQASTALDTLTRAASGAAGALAKQPTAAGPALSPEAGTSGEVTVTAPRRGIKSPEELFAGAIGGVATKVTGLFTNPETASKIGQNLGKFAGKGLAGAFEGQAAASIAGLVGIKTNQTGSAIGGMIGGLTGIPGAGAALGLIGGLVGNLFNKPKSGSATISSVDGAASLRGDGKITEALSGTAKSVQSGIQKIADALGADVGSFNVSIGKREDYYRVDGSGSSRVDAKHPGSGLLYNGKDESAAIEIAIRDAIADGAVKVTGAVAKALQSSSSLDKAVAEAVKVQALERSLGGLTGQLKSVFDTFDRTAADRVRIAKTYGLDLLQVEKLNAEERAKLLDDTLRSRVGSLKDLLTSLSSGDLFEGSAADRRKTLLSDIATARADAEEGKTGAADRMAELYRQLLATSKEAFGTGGEEYAADRKSAAEAARAIVDLETNRVNSAAGVQAAQTAAIQTGNSLTEQVVAAAQETNDLLRQLVDQGAGKAARSVDPDMTLIARDYAQ